MFSQAAVRSAPQAYPAPSGKHRVLIVTDCSERLRGWQGSMRTEGIEITGAASSVELSRACHREHDLAVIDVGAGSLPEVLRMLRSSVQHSGIALLVEASRVLTEPGLTGLLPKYRAMPCSRSDLLKLARDLMANDERPAHRRMLL
jgi:DNA-binding response OmpR family regulator